MAHATMNRDLETLPKQEKDSCKECKGHASRKHFTIVLKYTMEQLLKKGPALPLHEFFKTINALLNSRGGEVVIHLNPVDPDGSTRIDLLDQKVDDKLLYLLPGNYLYHKVYERHFVDSHHLLYRVKPLPADRPYSTLDFNSKFPVNKGLVEPSQDQMKAFIQNILDNLTKPDEARQRIVLSGIQEGQQPMVAFGVGEPRPFHEGLSIQAKVVPNLRSINRLSKPYIPAFSKLPKGGSVFLGIQEETNVLQMTPRYVEVADTSQVTEFTIQFQDGHNTGYKIWKEERINDESFYHIMKEDQVPRNEIRTGKFLVLGVKDAAQIEEEIKSIVTRDLKWVGVWEPRDVVTVQRLPVEGTTLQVIQVNIGFYKGICFDDPNGPEMYKSDVIAGRKEIMLVPLGEWLKIYEASSLTVFNM